MEKQRKKVLLAAVAMLSGIGAFAQRHADTKGNQEQGNDTPLYGSGSPV